VIRDSDAPVLDRELEDATEFTAFNVYSQVWIFPTKSPISLADLCARLRRLDKFKRRVLNIAYKESHVASIQSSHEKVSPCFWAFTPRKQVPLLRETFRAAFLTLFNKFTDKTQMLRRYQGFLAHRLIFRGDERHRGTDKKALVALSNRPARLLTALCGESRFPLDFVRLSS
jgi:hypothetical protein